MVRSHADHREVPSANRRGSRVVADGESDTWNGRYDDSSHGIRRLPRRRGFVVGNRIDEVATTNAIGSHQ